MPITDSEILRRARGKIARQSQSHICIAISSVRAPERQKRSLRDWVSHMLKGHGTYESWLHRRHQNIYWKMSRSDHRQARLQWLDWMIAYCEKQEAKKQ